MTSIARRAAARPSVLSWKSALARRRGRKTSGATISTARADARWIDPESSRSPSGTATRATDTEARVSSTRAETNATRRVATLARRSPSAASAMRSRWPVLRPNALSTGSPSKMSAICLPKASTWLQRRAASRPLDWPTRKPNTGKRQRTATTMIADTQSSAPITATRAIGTAAASTRSGRQRPM